MLTSNASCCMQGPFPAAKTKHCVRTDLQVPTPVDSVAEGPAEVCWHGCNVALAARAAGTTVVCMALEVCQQKLHNNASRQMHPDLCSHMSCSAASLLAVSVKADSSCSTCIHLALNLSWTMICRKDILPICKPWIQIWWPLS